MTDSRYYHGPQNCRACFSGAGDERRLGDWRLINNPGYYGSSQPEILVLGFSKGANQIRAAEQGEAVGSSGQLVAECAFSDLLEWQVLSP